MLQTQTYVNVVFVYLVEGDSWHGYVAIYTQTKSDREFKWPFAITRLTVYSIPELDCHASVLEICILWLMSVNVDSLT